MQNFDLNVAKQIAFALTQDDILSNIAVNKASMAYNEMIHTSGEPENAERAFQELVYSSALELISQEEEQEAVEEVPETYEEISDKNAQEVPIEELFTPVAEKEEFYEEDEQEYTDMEEEEYVEPVEEAAPLPKVSRKPMPEKIAPAVQPEQEKDESAFEEFTEESFSEDVSNARIKAKKKQNKTKTALIIIIILLAVIFLWLLYGVLINIQAVPSFDLGYTWFNDHIFPAFFL